ncbi:MAG: NAD-dependent epimerase/dehydratase family protein [Acidimicrobiia bacterium]|nr:NAD-dependent epimerase/dehydratase family protein [Acidimicrobiia bacterium]
MTTFGLTGAAGFLGWHTRAHLRATGIEPKLAHRETVGDAATLRRFVSDVDVVLHVAGVNRGSDSEVYEGNVELADNLAAALAASDEPRAVVFANSTKAGDDSAYGRSKERAGQILADTQATLGGRFVDVRLPHLFGEHGKPFYNSGVTTFAYQLANGQEPQIDIDAELELFHAQDAAALLIRSADVGSDPPQPKGRRILVSEALALLRRLSAPYLTNGVIPEMVDAFEVRMFNMFRSHLFPNHVPIKLTPHRDGRGAFVETVRSEGKGQVAVSTTAAGETRGEHFHFNKIERFVVISGDATVRIRRLLDDHIHQYFVSGDDPVAIDMPTLHAHNISNSGSRDLITMFWANELFEPDNPDTIREPV